MSHSVFLILDKYPYGVYTGSITYENQEIIATMDSEVKKDGCSCCGADARSGRTTQRSVDEKKKLINRLSRIEGQIRGIRSMVEKDAYCVDILTQSAAAGAALDAFSRQVLSRHMHTCMADDIRQGNDETIDELMDILQRLMK